MTADFTGCVLAPLKYMEFYTQETPAADVLKSFKKEKVELAFSKLVKLERKQPDEERKKFILEYGRFFRTCPRELNFEFIDQPLTYFVTRLEHPALVTISAIIFNESRIHKAKQNPCEENFNDLKNSMNTLHCIDVASSSQDGLSFPPMFADLFSKSLDHAQKFPYRSIAQPKSLSSGIVANPSPSPSVGLGVPLNRNFRFNWAQLPPVVKSSSILEDDVEVEALPRDDFMDPVPNSKWLDSSLHSEAMEFSHSDELMSSRRNEPKSFRSDEPKSSSDSKWLDSSRYGEEIEFSPSSELMSSRRDEPKSLRSDEPRCSRDSKWLDASQYGEEMEFSQRDELMSLRRDETKSSQSDEPKSSSDEPKSSSDEFMNTREESEWTTVKRKKRKNQGKTGKKKIKRNPELETFERNNPKSVKKSNKRRSFSQERPLDLVSSEYSKPKRLNWNIIPKIQKEVDSDEGNFLNDEELERDPTDDNLINDPTNSNEELECDIINDNWEKCPPKMGDAEFENYNADDGVEKAITEADVENYCTGDELEKDYTDTKNNVVDPAQKLIDNNDMIQDVLSLRKDQIFQGDTIDLTGEDSGLNQPQDTDHCDRTTGNDNCNSDDEKLLKLAEVEPEKSKRDQEEKNKLLYSKLSHRSAEEIINIIDEENLPPIYTDSIRSLILYLVDNNKVDIDSTSLQTLRNAENSSRYFHVLEKCFLKWPNEEIASDDKTEYGTKKVIFNDNPNSFLKTRNYKQMKKSRAKCNEKDPVSRYYCTGGKVCTNDSCLFKKCYKDENLVCEKRNTSQLIEENENGRNITYCLYCKSDGIKESTIENLSCDARLYWKTNTNVIYTMNKHSCFSLHCLKIPQSFKEGFDRKLGYNSEVKHNIRKQLENQEYSVEDMYKNASKISVGSKKGSQAKIELLGRPSPVKTRLDETVKRLKALDKNFILEYSSNCIVTSSTKSLRKALQFDIRHGIFSEPGFMDVCFSRVQGTSWVACSVYFYDPIGRSVIKVANGYIPSENTESVCQVISVFNRGIGQLILEEKLLDEETRKQIEQDGFRLQPRQFFVDFNDVNHAAFISAGYPVAVVNQMLEGCGKHFHDMVEQVKVPFKKEDKPLIETHLFNWKDCIIIDKIQTYFDTIRTFVIQKLKDEKVKDDILGKLKWWKDRLPCWSKAYSGVKHVDSNLSEVGHSKCLKHSSIDEAITDDIVTNFHDFGRLIAVGGGSLKATGAGPDYEHIQTLKRMDMNNKMTQIEKEFHNPTPDESNENIGGYDIDDDLAIPERIRETTSAPIQKRSVRSIKSTLFKQNHTNSRKLQVSVRQIVVDTPIKKEIKVFVSQQYGRYSKGEVFVMSFESLPCCNCSFCTRISQRNGRREVCSPQIWMREHLLGMSDESVHINQVYFSPDVTENLLRSWRPPVVDSEVDLTESFRLKERTYPKENIKYYLEKTSVHTTRRRCFGSCHHIYGKEINTPPGSLNVCAEKALKVPVGKPEAVSGPIYMCATKKCAYTDPPRRTNLTSSSAPGTISIRDPLNIISSEEIRQLEENEEFIFL